MDKPNLIMLPGWGMESCVWNPIKPILERYFNLIFIEWNDIKSIDCCKDKVIKVISDNKLHSFNLLGWSLGSLVGLEIALEYGEKVKNIILFGATSCFTRKSNEYLCGWHRQIVNAMKRNLQKDKDKTLMNFYEAMFSENEKNRGCKDEFIKMVNENFKNRHIAPLLTGLEYLMEKDLRHMLKDIKVPLLIIQGKEDSICPFEASQYIVEKVQQISQLKLLEGVGHIPFYTSAKECEDIIAKYVSERG